MRIVFRTGYDGDPVLALSTGLSPNAAAKSGIQRLAMEVGHRITPDGHISSWIPEGTFVRDDSEQMRTRHDNSGLLHVYGPDFDGESLLDIMNDSNRNRSWKRCHACLSAIARTGTEAGERGTALLRDAGQSGPEAIFMAGDGSILVLPGSLYQRAISSHGEHVERENRLEWVHPDSGRRNAKADLAFLAAAIAYRIAGGVSPFMTGQFWQLRDTTAETEESFIARLVRNAYVLPLSQINPAIPSRFSESVHAALTGDAPENLSSILESTSLESTEFDSPLPDLKGCPDSPDTVRQVVLSPAVDSMQRKLARALFFKKHSTKFLFASLVLIFFAVFGGMYVSDITSKPSTAGLEASEVVHGFYDAVARLDADTITSYATTRASSEYINLVSALYMTNRLLGRDEKGEKFVDPVRLFSESLNDSYTVYGITRFEREEMYHTEHESGFTVSFYLFLPEETRPLDNMAITENSGMPLTVYRYRDSCTLTMTGDQWRITAIDQLERTLVEDSGSNIFKAVASGVIDGLPYAPLVP